MRWGRFPLGSSHPGPGRAVPSAPRAVPGAARLLPYVLGLSWLTASAALASALLDPERVQAHAFAPLLAGLFCFGLPHGALDHLVPARLGVPWSRRPLRVGAYLLLYLALAGAALALWYLLPRLAFVGFLLLTVAHWGHGDLRFWEQFWGYRPPHWGAWVIGFVRGALPIALPVLAFPETAASLYHHAALGLGLVAAPLPLAAPQVAWPLRTTLVAALVLYGVAAVRAAPRRVALAADLFEVALLLVLFALTPAYFAVGVYFVFWHAPRHLARLMLLRRADAEAVAAGRLGGPLYRLARDTLPLTLAALSLLGGLYGVAAARVSTLEGFVALYLVLISALTLPHAVVVALMDVWEPQR
jgi:Brp/Blh family beta-carotene 15,15'-monooxygenase